MGGRRGSISIRSSDAERGRDQTEQGVMAALDELVEVGKRLNREAAQGRPADQPHGDYAQITATHWGLFPICGVEILDANGLFRGGRCPDCLIPVGDRDRRRMKVRFRDAMSRSSDGLLAQLPERFETAMGPTYHLFSEHFLTILPGIDRRRFRWREVEIVNPSKITSRFFEIVSSRTHLDRVALRGGNPDQESCRRCGRIEQPRYPQVGNMPDWLDPHGDLVNRGQASFYVADAELPVSAAWFAMGDWQRGVHLVSSRVKPKKERPGFRGISLWPVGSVGPILIELVGPR